MLYVVATPIGNLGDISQRALEVLRNADVVASEDTRYTGRLLKHFGISRPQISFHEHNERQAAEKIIALLREGRTVALVSDAGTPGISDPGFVLVRRCIDEGLPLTMIPGPAAFVMALVLSGLPTHAFIFRGFPPRKPTMRRRFLAVDAQSPHTLIFYESPHRVAALIADAIAVYGDRRAALANDLTKMFERVDRGRLSALLAQVQSRTPKGEYVLVIEGAARAEGGPPEEEDEASQVTSSASAARSDLRDA
ncbi:MAG: 16S rRNA (cytidine(1402)-2'-O)-methyltransferase [Chloroflexi bacterium]|jgi:16S rRNA (cytidine1402-2'-O)-methyltransferase|uniref:Ribosomal RNA small subunit methyltransferase I n=1 Tax=Candidatus Thermofonsia Clade 3 bacterium TaxID=2364212 RepID=A0A2M8QB83_9CHLR|nr:16S rRNA (cytidine(1402)-2'-O)-methyltransferase [Candidatus Roseilinea sp. NK_OTU-006]PJF47057.1 MAG: 16S rRNA (cytidine(1402)-2'-O)-methyltransferase [Candidatus Thermofonsia Clade 3 bacterium]RMG62567.1 MAG: 16S rRNA (cytidine(1402)-2'-O)-methyltransferase [Chloroflexota bacterium]